MPDQKISTFTDATVLSGVEKLTGLQGGVNKNFELDLIADYAKAGKQDTLVSGTNIKTINGSSILGSGNLAVSGGGVLFSKTTLSSAQILDLFTTPVEMVAAPGANKIIRPINLTVRSYGGVISYTGNGLFVYLNGAGASIFSSIQEYKNAPIMANYNPNNGSYLVSGIDTPLMVSVSANPTGGDISFDMYLTYTILDI